MASFTDNSQRLSQFNPYIQQLPIEEMVKVGMYKQGQYDQGIEQIQSSFDAIGKLPISNKAGYQAYLQNKLNRMGNNIKAISMSDFSNQQLIGSTTSQINSIANDDIIETGIQSALRQQKETEFMEKEREKGTLTPQNEADYNKRSAEWFNDADLKKGFNVKYTPFIDVDKKVQETFDKLKPGSYSFDQIYKIDEATGRPKRNKDGSYQLNDVMTRKKEEGLFPPQVDAALSQILNEPSIKQQLAITGKYNYRNIDQINLGEIATERINNKKDALEKEIDSLNMNLAINSNDIDSKNKLLKYTEKLAELKNDFDGDMQAIQNNPESFRANLYQNQVKQNYKSMYGVTKVSEETLRNPSYDVMQENNKFQQEMNFKVSVEKNNRLEEAAKLKLGYAKLDNDRAIATKKDKLHAAANGLNPDGTKKLDTVAINETNEDAYVMRETRIESASKNARDSKLNLLSNFTTDEEKKELEKLQVKGKSVSEAMEIIYTKKLKETKTKVDDFITYKMKLVGDKLSNKKMNYSPEIKDAYLLQQNSENDFQKEKAKYDVSKNLTTSMLELNNIKFEETTLAPFSDPIGGSGLSKPYKVTKSTAIDMAIIAKFADKTFVSKIAGTDEFKALQNNANGAKQRLKNKKLDELIKYAEESIYSTSGSDKFLVTLKKMQNSIDAEKLTKGDQANTEAIYKVYGKNPNTAIKLITGNPKIDQSTGSDVQFLINNAKIDGRLGDSDAKDYALSFEKAIKKEGLAKALVSTGTQLKQVTNYDGNTNTYFQNSDGIIIPITALEAEKYFKVFNENLFQNPLILDVQSSLKINGNQSQKGNLKSLETYKYIPSILNNNNYPNLTKAGIPIKIAIKNTNDKFYGYINSEDKILPTEGYPTLEELVQKRLLNIDNPALINEMFK